MVDNKTKLKRLLWLAFQASQPMGMGFLHVSAAETQTEDSVYESCNPQDKNEIHTDYVFGRMMKTTFKVKEDETLSVSPKTPRLDYQSWGRKYGTASDLIQAAEQSLI